MAATAKIPQTSFKGRRGAGKKGETAESYAAALSIPQISKRLTQSAKEVFKEGFQNTLMTVKSDPKKRFLSFSH